MHIFSSSNGEWSRGGERWALGYSGFGSGKNNPALEQAPNVGPIPCGLWRIVGPPVDTPTHGPFVLHLEPCEGTPTYGRDGFLIHGDSKENPGTASHGCIVLPRATRERIWNSGDHLLTVA